MPSPPDGYGACNWCAMKNELPHLLKPLSQPDRVSQRIGVVLPIPDASPRLKECLTALTAALAYSIDKGHEADLYVVIDGRNAAGAAIASTFAVHLVTADFSDLASARASGARAALAAGVSWLAFTESHALVAESWLVEQISSDAELLIGGIEITNGFMTDPAEDFRCGWRDDEPMQPFSAHFGNLGMSRSAFELAAHLDGPALRLDAGLLDQLTTLEIATHRCDKPLVYARSQDVEDMTFSEVGVAAARAPALGGFELSMQR